MRSGWWRRGRGGRQAAAPGGGRRCASGRPVRAVTAPKNDSQSKDRVGIPILYPYFTYALAPAQGRADFGFVELVKLAILGDGDGRSGGFAEVDADALQAAAGRVVADVVEEEKVFGVDDEQGHHNGAAGGWFEMGGECLCNG